MLRVLLHWWIALVSTLTILQKCTQSHMLCAKQNYSLIVIVEPRVERFATGDDICGIIWDSLRNFSNTFKNHSIASKVLFIHKINNTSLVCRFWYLQCESCVANKNYLPQLAIVGFSETNTLGALLSAPIDVYRAHQRYFHYS